MRCLFLINQPGYKSNHKIELFSCLIVVASLMLLQYALLGIHSGRSIDSLLVIGKKRWLFRMLFYCTFEEKGSGCY